MESPSIDTVMAHAVVAAAHGDDVRQSELGVFLLGHYPFGPLMSGLTYAVATTIEEGGGCDQLGQTASRLAESLGRARAAPLLEAALELAVNEQWPGEDQPLLRTDIGLVMVFIVALGALARGAGLGGEGTEAMAIRLAGVASQAATFAMTLEPGTD